MQIRFLFINKKANWLLYLGGVLLPLSLIYTILAYQGKHQISSREIVNTSFELYIVSTILIAPLLEELVFRSFFSKKLAFKIFSLLSTLIFTILVAQNSFSYFILPIYLGLGVFSFSKNSTRLMYVLFFFNALLFSIVHYETSDFSNFTTSVPLLIHFSGGLLLIWIVLNFNLLRAILFHFSWNLILMCFFVASVQFVDSETKTYEREEYVLLVQEVPRIPSCKSTLVYHKNEIEIQCMELRKIYSLTKNKVDAVDDYFSTSFKKYNIQIQFKENYNQKKMNRILIESLNKEGFLKAKN